MKIDWTRPIEFDDGRLVTVESIKPGQVLCKTVGPVYRGQGVNEKQHQMYWYNDNGRFLVASGSDTDFYRIRNVDDAASFIPEDWS